MKTTVEAVTVPTTEEIIETTKEVLTTVAETTAESTTTETLVREVSDIQITFEDIYMFIDLIGIVLGIIVSITAIIVFVRTYITKNIVFLNWTNSCSITDGYRFGITLQNKGLSTVSIKKVVLCLDNEHIVLKQVLSPMSFQDEDEDEIVIEPFHTQRIISNGATVPLFENKLLSNYQKMALKIEFSDGTTKIIKYKNKKRKNITYNEKRPHSEEYKGILVTSFLRYVVEIIDSSGEKNSFGIYNHGYVKEEFFGIKSIPVVYMKNETFVKGFLEENLKGSISSVEVFKVTPQKFVKESKPNAKN